MMKLLCCLTLAATVLTAILAPVKAATTLKCHKEKSKNCVIPSLVSTNLLEEVHLPDLSGKTGLQIVGGNLTTFSEKLSKQLGAVTKLQLGSLQLKEVFLKPELVELVAAGNQIEVVKFKTSSADYKLEMLDLKENRLKNLDGFEVLRELRELDLGGNDLEIVDLRVFSGMINLKKLNLGRNQLITVFATESIELATLEYLSLSGNKLTNLDVTNWHLESLTECDVSSNDLVYINAIEKQFPSLQKISLVKNWWDCLWLDDTLKHFNKISVAVRDQDENCEDKQNVTNICCVAVVDTSLTNDDELSRLRKLKEEQINLHETLEKDVGWMERGQETKLKNLDRDLKDLEDKAKKLLPLSMSDSLSKMEFVELKKRAQALKSTLEEQLAVWKKQKKENDYNKQRLQHTIVDQRRSLDRVTQKIKETQAQFELLRDYVGGKLKKRN